MRLLTAAPLLVALVDAQAPMRAIAKIRGAHGNSVTGSVIFEQDTNLGNMTVIVDITGLTAGLHGFHVHQYGDVRETSTLDTMAAHFVPMCSYRRHLEGGAAAAAYSSKPKHSPAHERERTGCARAAAACRRPAAPQRDRSLSPNSRETQDDRFTPSAHARRQASA